MPPTPKDLKNFADKNRNNPKEVFKKLIDTTITHVSPHGSHRSGDLRDRVTKEVLSRHIATQLSNHAPGDIMIIETLPSCSGHPTRGLQKTLTSSPASTPPKKN